MDKDLLRIAIIAVGGVVILGMIVWAVLKSGDSSRKTDSYDDESLDNDDRSFGAATSDDDFDVTPLGSALDDDDVDDPIFASAKQSDDALEPIEIPQIIQLSLMSKTEQGFNGADLLTVFQLIGLEYGSMKVFERLDGERQVDYTVASMVAPGLFPETDLESFFTPGIVFYLQAGELGDNGLSIFNELIQAVNLLAFDLDGVKLDHMRETLTDETIERFRLGFEAR